MIRLVASEQARNEASAIVLLAKARVGELTREMPQADRGGKPDRGASNSSKSGQLTAEGLSRKDAAECEKIAFARRGGTNRRGGVDV